MDRLRESDDLDTLFSTVAAAYNINVTYVEKDFWALEALRALTAFGDGAGAGVIFKGGTSLSRAWNLTSRFSEDIDVVIDFPTDWSNGARDRFLKAVRGKVQEHLGLGLGDLRESHSTTGVARSVHIQYPIRYASDSDEIKPEVLLEMGSRGAPTPNRDVPILSFAAQYLIDNGVAKDEFEELAPVVAHVLEPVRTLIEKVALLANLDKTFAAGNQDAFKAKGRHLYDIHQVLGDGDVIDALSELGSTGIADVATDVHDRSVRAKWPSVPRPADGWTLAMECLNPGTPAAAALKDAYQQSAVMIYGALPPFDSCIARMATSGRII
jgi:hypothetical protein